MARATSKISSIDITARFEYALAAYNAGTDRVDSWLADGKYRDTQEFVESIPFTETREYVQAILRNVSLYGESTLSLPQERVAINHGSK